MKDTDLRRRASRYPLRWKAAVIFYPSQGKPIVHTQTQDVSAFGAAIFSDHGDLTGSVVHLFLADAARKGSKSPKLLKVRARVVSTVRAPGMSQYRHGLSFLRAPDDGLEVLDEILVAASALEPAPVVSPAGNRLAQLKRLAQTKAADAKKSAPPQDHNALISEALGKTYRYLQSFASRLNGVHPAYPKRYAIAGVPDFAGLAWEHGYTDFRERVISPTAKLYKEVLLRFRLSGKKDIRVTREYPASEKLKQLLEDSKIDVATHDTRNKRGLIERTTFVFPCEVAASLQLMGQFESGKLLLRTRNVCVFGSMEQILAPEAVTDESLSELGAFILCETAKLGPLLLRNA